MYSATTKKQQIRDSIPSNRKHYSCSGFCFSQPNLHHHTFTLFTCPHYNAHQASQTQIDMWASLGKMHQSIYKATCDINTKQLAKHEINVLINLT